MIVYKEKLVEFGNFLLSINNDDSKKMYINDILINSSMFNSLVTIKCMRKEDESENKTETEVDNEGNETTIQKYSQIQEFIHVYGLESSEENIAKLHEYLDYFLSVKDSYHI